MNASLSFINDYFSFLDSNAENSNEMIICPPDIYLESVKKTAPNFIKTGAQNISSNNTGAYTGECSGEMLADNSVQYVIIGHSERRQYHQESNEDIKLKLLKAIDSDIKPILCIGESKEERESDQTFDVIDKQIRSVLDSDILSKDIGLLIAYEPIWAIGTGLTATPQMANDVIMSLERNMDDEGEMTDYASGINEENVIKDLAQADDVIKMIKMMNPDVRADLLMRIARMVFVYSRVCLC